MPPSDDLFYARLLTLSDAELFTYIHHYTDYKVDAVQAALAEVHTRGLYVSEAVLADIERYLMRHEQQRMRPCNRDPRHLRWLAFAIVIIGLGSAMFLYTTASPPPQYPLGYDPFDSKKYLRELARIIHQSQKPTEEGALGSRMILKTALSPERHHPNLNIS